MTTRARSVTPCVATLGIVALETKLAPANPSLGTPRIY